MERPTFVASNSSYQNFFGCQITSVSHNGHEFFKDLTTLINTFEEFPRLKKLVVPEEEERYYDDLKRECGNRGIECSVEVY